MPTSTFSFVPKLDMTIEWTDKKLYERYELTNDEIAFIEKMIKEME
jgi:site-specific DNA-methyltransferase (adenine-specific)